MGEAENRQTAERVFRAINDRDVSLFHDQFHAHSVIDFPQSGERIVGDENRRGVYSSFPGRADVTRILTGGDLAIVEANVDYPETKDWRALFVYECRDGKIEKATCYWAAPFEPRRVAGRVGRAHRRLTLGRPWNDLRASPPSSISRSSIRR